MLVEKVKNGFGVPHIVVPIDPDTLCEYTGIKDIFENDIVSVLTGPDKKPAPMRVFFKYGIWFMEFLEDTLIELYSYEDKIEGVIGNMFDSPEKFITK